MADIVQFIAQAQGKSQRLPPALWSFSSTDNSASRDRTRQLIMRNANDCIESLNQ